ncbi:MAG: hypothetical protein ACRD21_16655 [Vicinamibacteria bacterium]
MSGVLVPGSRPVKDVLGSLEEVHRTYRAVGSAVDKFVAPAAGRAVISPTPYLAFERGSLRNEIEAKRGHCARILEYYGRVGGLRDWLEPRLEKKKLNELDEVFGKLSTADGDLFARLSQVGEVLTEEASSIATLLLADQQRAARARILDGRKKLLPLERGLRAAMTKMQRIETSLGYVPPLNGSERRTR